MDKPVKKRPKLYIVNLQWTPKDDHSTLKINGEDSIILMTIHLHCQQYLNFVNAHMCEEIVVEVQVTNV